MSPQTTNHRSLSTISLHFPVLTFFHECRAVAKLSQRDSGNVQTFASWKLVRSSGPVGIGKSASERREKIIVGGIVLSETLGLSSRSHRFGTCSARSGQWPSKGRCLYVVGIEKCHLEIHCPLTYSECTPSNRRP